MNKTWFAIFRKLLVTSAKELLRDFRPLFSWALMPAIFLIIFGIVRLYTQRSGASGSTDGTITGSDFFLFIMPALLALGLVNLALFGTALPLITAKDKGILRQYLVIPVPLSALLAAHVLVRLAVAFVQAGILLTVGGLVFGVTFHANPFSFFIVYLICAVVMITCGYALAGLVNSLSAGNALIGLLSFYVMGFGQIFTDMHNVPVAKWLIYSTPASSVSDLLRQLLIERWANLSISANLLILLGWLIAAFAIGIRRFRFLPE